MPITQLPTPPSRADSTNFAARADSLLTALPTFVTEANALQSSVEANKNYVSSAWDAAGGITVGLGQAVSAASSAATSADRAIAAWSASTAPTEQLSAISKSLHVGTVVKSIIYDTSKDSDGGAWRKRMQDKSWYNETLGGSTWLGQQPSSATARAYLGSLSSPELVTNGTFTTDTSGWTSSNATLSVVGGQLKVVGTGGTTYPKADLVLTLIVGRTYHVQFEITTASTHGITIVGETLDPQTGAGYYYPNAIGTHTVSFVATNTTRILSLVTNPPNTSTGSFDNVSVKIVDPAIATAGYVYQSKSDNKFYRLETSGVTEVFRGISREFPAVVAIVAEASRVVIYDLTVSSCPMWMVFVTTYSLYAKMIVAPAAGPVASMIAGAGKLLVGASAGYGLSVVDFIADAGSKTIVAGLSKFPAPIMSRNSELSTGPVVGPGIVNATVNDIAITVLDTAPIDPSTGLPVPTIAVATAGGASVIKDDGTVINHTASGYIDWKRIGFFPDSRLWAHIGNDDRRIGLLKTGIPTVSTTLLSDFNVYSDPPANGQFPYVRDSVFSRYATAVGRDVYGAGSSGVFAFKTNPSSFTKSMQAQITNAYNTGWLPGDIRGAYLADTTAETITASGELVTNGTFTTDTSGWTPYQGGILSVSSGRLLITNDGTGTSSGAAYQSFTTIVGKSYILTYTAIAGTSGAATARVGTAFGSANLATQSGIGTFSLTFVATTTSTFVTLYTNDITASRTAMFDDISCKLAEPDRSVKNTGLVLNGTLTKTAVASGAGLVAYSGFSVSNYLEQPYNSNLDFGTGDFCVMGWVTPSSLASLGYLFGRQNSGATGSRFYSYVSATTGLINFNVTDGTTSVPISGGTAVLSTPTFVVCYKQGAVMYLSVNATQVATATAPALTFNNATAVFRLGVDHTASNPFLGSLALWRISATAPNADQIAHIYRTELPLFQAGAQCTLAGTSTAVTALAYDKVADELHVGTSWGRSEFHDLLRVASEATTAGAITSLSANEGAILTCGTSARVYAPALVLRDELAKPSQGSAQPQPYQQFSVKDQQVFLSQAGVKIVGVYIRGMLKKPGVDYTVTYDGFRYTVTTTDKLASRTEVTLLQIKE